MNTIQMTKEIFNSALQSVYPAKITQAYAEQIHSFYKDRDFSRLLVAGFGKAAYKMAIALEEVLSEEISEGIIVTKYGHAEIDDLFLKKIKVFEAAHPIPDQNGVEATDKIIRMLNSADENTLVVCLISGGGSALFVSPAEGITLVEKQEITNVLMKAGADITELNAVRKHMSRVKGGRLAEIIYPAEVISLMISDVIGDSLEVIASGPTAPDTSTFMDAMNVIKKYNLQGRAPDAVLKLISKGVEGEITDTPDIGNAVFQKVQNIIIGSNRKAIDAAYSYAVASGFETVVLTAELSGDAGDAARWLADKARESKEIGVRRCFISGGETTVVVKGDGKGGRNTELALCFAIAVKGLEGVTLLSAGTDGTDGPTDAAGAVVNGETVTEGVECGIDAAVYLANNDSYNFFERINSLVKTGPTGTNVMDIQIMIVE